MPADGPGGITGLPYRQVRALERTVRAWLLEQTEAFWALMLLVIFIRSPPSGGPRAADPLSVSGTILIVNEARPR